jgi:flagellar basal-body rod modification protein FlgD
MQINPIGSTTSTSSSSGSTSATALPTQTLNQGDFLTLLADQMQAQDPLNPMPDTEFVSQMATFTSLQQMQELSQSFSSFSSEAVPAAVTAYLGKTVTLPDSTQASGSASGVVTGLTFNNGTPQIIVNGKSYDPTTITAIQTAAATGTTATTTTSGSTPAATQ